MPRLKWAACNPGASASACRYARAAVHRKEKRKWMDEMGRYPEQYAPFVSPLEDEPEVAVLEITKPAVNEAR